MAGGERDYKKRYEELMRNAGAKKRALNRAALERERALLKAAKERKYRREQLAVERKAGLLRAIKAEIKRLTSLIGRTARAEERIGLRAEAAYLRRLLRKTSNPRRPRKPPESGLSVPAIPPKGPFPKQGGAAAPLEFDD